MDNGHKSTLLALTLLLGIFLQVLFVFADNIQSPSKTAVEFSKAYFMLDPSMATYLCTDLVDGDDGNAVERLLENTVLEAQQRGFTTNYLRSYLFHTTTETISKTDESAQVRIHSMRRKNIHPVFAIIAKIFSIGGTHTVDEVINMIKEDGKWKICGNPYSLT